MLPAAHSFPDSYPGLEGRPGRPALPNAPVPVSEDSSLFDYWALMHSGLLGSNTAKSHSFASDKASIP